MRDVQRRVCFRRVLWHRGDDGLPLSMLRALFGGFPVRAPAVSLSSLPRHQEPRPPEHAHILHCCRRGPTIAGCDEVSSFFYVLQRQKSIDRLLPGAPVRNASERGRDGLRLRRVPKMEISRNTQAIENGAFGRFLHL